MTVKSLDQLNLKNKRVLVRVDYNVPLDENLQITDDTRIQASLPTLRHLLEQDCQITLMSHLGRPKGTYQAKFSMKPVAAYLSKLLEQEVVLVEDVENWQAEGKLRLLENLRFHAGETKNDETLAKSLARFGDVYVNDAFGAAHRAHASIAATAQLFTEKGAGLLMMKEIHYMRESLKEPERPFLSILGGAKVSDKIQLISNLLNKVDQLMIGGGMSYTFLKAMGINVGNSLVETDFLDEAKRLIEACKEKGVTLLLPQDHLSADAFKEDAATKITLNQDIDDGYMGLDIGPETINAFNNAISNAKTIVWNGPMGVFEWDSFSTGTISVADAMAESQGLTIIGGGDSVAAAGKAGVTQDIDHISTGGGASLELLGGNILPGIVALEQS